MNYEIIYQFKQRIKKGVYHFDFLLINEKNYMSNKVGYIIVNTLTGNMSYHLSTFVLEIVPISKEEINKRLKTIMEAAVALNTTIG